jgi:hypothetical protein
MLNVIKATGEIEPFSEEKLRTSIRRAGIKDEAENAAINQIKNSLYDNIPTSLIYNQIKQVLGNSMKEYGNKYSLKQAIMELGPTGYPFEDLIAEILNAEGYKTQVRQILLGKCIHHEVDVVAEKDGKKIMVEAKFHNLPGRRTDVHVSLYTKSRFEDLKDKIGFTDALLITNTKMTNDAITYANCAGIKILSWSYPHDNSLRDMIERQKVYPITQLTTLTPPEKNVLIENHFVSCRSLSPECLSSVGISEEKTREILKEVEFIMKSF